VEDFMNQFLIPNQKRTEIKKLISHFFDELKNHNLILNRYPISDNSEKRVIVNSKTINSITTY